MRPLGKYIVVSDVEEQVKTDYGFAFTTHDTKTMRYKTARVIKPGSDVTTLVGGELVYYDKSNSHQMIVSGRVVTVILERDVVVVLEEPSSDCSEASLSQDSSS